MTKQGFHEFLANYKTNMSFCMLMCRKHHVIIIMFTPENTRCPTEQFFLQSRLENLNTSQ